MEKLFRKFAGNGRSADTQMIDSTHVKAHRSAGGGTYGPPRPQVVFQSAQTVCTNVSGLLAMPLAKMPDSG